MNQSGLRAAAALYAVLMVLLALGLVAVVVVLNMAFGWKGTRSDWEFLAVMGAPAVLALVLAVFIWKQHVWAMVVALAVGVTLRALFGSETLFLNIMLTGGSAAAAVVTGLHLWLGGNARV
jgi:ABC-type enterochelin transport system permease subunit